MLDLDLFEPMNALLTSRAHFCVVTIVDGRGSIPQIIGAKAIFTRDGLVHGTVGGGRLEAKITEEAQALLAGGISEPTQFLRWSLRKDVGMTCGGDVALFFELHGPRTEWPIVVFGAGHISQKLCRLLAELDCQVTCFDTRAQWLDLFKDDERIETHLVENYSDGIDSIEPGAYVIIVTKGHETDLPILEALSRSEIPLPYLGVIGSDSKARKVKRDLREAGVSPEFVSHMICPIGDKVGNNTPTEISFGIVSQVLRHRRQQSC